MLKPWRGRGGGSQPSFIFRNPPPPNLFRVKLSITALSVIKVTLATNSFCLMLSNLQPDLFVAFLIGIVLRRIA